MSTAKSNPLSGLTVSSIVLFLRRRSFLTVAIVSWAVMAILTLLVVIPQINLIIAHNQDLGVEEKKLSDLQARSTFLATIDKKAISDDSILMQAVLPSGKPVTPLISSIERLAAQSSAALASYELTPGSVATGAATAALPNVAVKSLVPGVGSLPVKLEVQGTFAQMNSFFKSLDTLVPLVNVKTIDFTILSSTQNVDPLTAQYKASVEMDSLYALPDTSKPSLNPTLTAFTAAQKNLIASLSASVASQPEVSASLVTPIATESSTLRPSIFTY